jgi:hypothetical protein
MSIKFIHVQSEDLSRAHDQPHEGKQSLKASHFPNVVINIALACHDKGIV